MYTILNLMSESVAIDGAKVFSVLGYSMLPITLLSAVRVFVDLRCACVRAPGGLLCVTTQCLLSPRAPSNVSPTQVRWRTQRVCTHACTTAERLGVQTRFQRHRSRASFRPPLVCHCFLCGPCASCAVCCWLPCASHLQGNAGRGVGVHGHRVGHPVLHPHFLSRVPHAGPAVPHCVPRVPSFWLLCAHHRVLTPPPPQAGHGLRAGC
jgi:hypothetical protein